MLLPVCSLSSQLFSIALILCMITLPTFSFFFFFNDTATTEIYTLSLHDALPISRAARRSFSCWWMPARSWKPETTARSEEHTSELQSQSNLVCRLLLEKKKKKKKKKKMIKIV